MAYASRSVSETGLRLDRFSYDIRHMPGKELYTADTLSRAPLAEDVQNTSLHCDLAKACVLSTFLTYLQVIGR